MNPTDKDVCARLTVLHCVIVHALATPPRPMLNDWFVKWSETERIKFDESCKKLADSNVSKLQGSGLWEHTSPAERIFLQSFGSNMEDGAHMAATWRMECAGVIMWALRYVSDWPPIDRQLNPDLLKSVHAKKFGLFAKRPNLRAQSELSAKRDLIELWHWRVRTRRLIEDGTVFEPNDAMKQAGLTSFDDIIRFSAKAAYQAGDLPELKDDDFVFLGRPFRELPSEDYQMATSIIMERHFALNWLCGMAPQNKWDETPTDT